jgi:hypothetical protein
MKRVLLFFFVPSAAIYLLMSLVYPTDTATIVAHHLTKSQAQVIALSVAIPLIITWFIAAYGAWKLKEYADSIKKYKDGAAFATLATGVQLLVIYMPVRSVPKILLNYFAYLHPGWTSATNLAITYINIILPLLAYMVIGNAARKLFTLAQIKVSNKLLYPMILIFSIIGVTFSYSTYSVTDKLTPSDWLVMTNYDIGIPLRIATVIIPYLFMWFVGMLAAYEIYLYQKYVKGVFYRQCLKLLSIGLTIEIISSIAIQYVITITPSLRHTPLGFDLSIVYSVIAIIILAFVLIAMGVNKLKQIEEL